MIGVGDPVDVSVAAIRRSSLSETTKKRIRALLSACSARQLCPVA